MRELEWGYEVMVTTLDKLRHCRPASCTKISSPESIISMFCEYQKIRGQFKTEIKKSTWRANLPNNDNQYIRFYSRVERHMPTAGQKPIQMTDLYATLTIS